MAREFLSGLIAGARLGLPIGANTTPSIGDLYASGNGVRYRDGSNVERALLNNLDNLANLSDAVQARANIGAAAVPQVYNPNNWIQPATGTVGPGTASTANTIYLYPFTVQRSITVSDLGARVTTAGTNFALAIYGSASGLPTGLPLASTGTLVGTAATVVPSTVTAFNLTAGTLYWGAFNSDAAITMMHLLGANTYFNTIIGTATLSEIASGGSISSWVRTLTGQTFTNPWPDLTGVTTTVTTTATTLRGALIFLKVSALL